MRKSAQKTATEQIARVGFIKIGLEYNGLCNYLTIKNPSDCRHLQALRNFFVNTNVGNIEQQLKQGDLSLFSDAFSRHRPRSWQIIHFRLSDQIRARVDADDVLQDVYLDAEKRLDHYVEGDFPSLFLWLRLVTGQSYRLI